MLVHTTASKLVAAAMTGGLVLSSSALVASGSLPAGAQQTVSDVLSRVGVDVPGPDEHAGTHPAEPDGGGDQGGGAGVSGNGGKGEEVSDLATTTDETGRDKGAQISDLASDGTSQAGEHGGDGTGGEAADEASDQAGTQDAGGAATGDEASSDAGAAAADEAQDGAGADTSDVSRDVHADEVAPDPGAPR